MCMIMLYFMFMSFYRKSLMIVIYPWFYTIKWRTESITNLYHSHLIYCKRNLISLPIYDEELNRFSNEIMSYFLTIENIKYTKSKPTNQQQNYVMFWTTRRNSSAVGFKHERSSNDVDPRLVRMAALVVLPKLIN